MDSLVSPLADRLREAIVTRGGKVAYISSSPQDEPYPYYRSTIADYTAIDVGISVDYIDLSSRFSDDDLQKLAEYGSIYLSGGNTFVFMDAARQRGLYPLLKAHNEADGVIVGTSAGAIMLTPSIELAADSDENSVHIRDFSGFGFVDFEFYPHWEALPEQHTFLAAEKERRHPNIYTCPDGSGIVVDSGIVHTFGDDTKLFH